MRTHHKTRPNLSIVVIGLAAVFFSFGCAGSRIARADRILILHTNDVHSHLDAFDDFNRNQHHPGTGGAPRRAAMISRLRAEGAPTLLLDAGDVFQGTPYFNFYQGRLDYQLMAMMKYDVAVLGNHDLDAGYAHQHELSPLTGCPILSANVQVPSASGSGKMEPLCPPDTLLEVGGHKVGIFGLTTEDLVGITDKRRNPGLMVLQAEPIAAEEVKKLRARGAELVIALTHIGLREDSSLALHVRGIDLIVGGHSHTFMNRLAMVAHPDARNGWGGTAIVQTGRYGVNLGRIDLDFDGSRPSRLEYKLLPIDETSPEDPAVAAFLQPYKAHVDSVMGEVIGTALGDYSQSESGRSETAIGDLVADALREATGADVGLENWGGIRASLSKGPVRLLDVFTMLPFDNEVGTAEYTAAQVKELFDYIARTNLARGRGQISGASFVQTPEGADSVLVGGKPLDPSRTYTVGSTDFLLNGGDGFSTLPKGANRNATGLILRDAMVNFIRSRGTIEPRLDGRLRTRN